MKDTGKVVVKFNEETTIQENLALQFWNRKHVTKNFGVLTSFKLTTMKFKAAALAVIRMTFPSNS
jgi:hypothetical protein